MSPETLYALAPAADVPEDAWKTRNAWTAALVSKGGKCIELYTENQLAGAAAASFPSRADVKLLGFSVDKMVEEADLEVKYEAASARVYGEPIPYACLLSAPVLLELADGKHVFPLLGAEADAAAAAAAAAKYDEGFESDAATDDGLPAFDQHTFDCDDDGADY